MAIPNLKALVLSVYAAGRYDLGTLEGCGAFTRACCVALHKVDARIVMLKKSAGRTHVVDSSGRRHGADAVLFLDNGKGTSVDLVGSSRTPQAKPSWTPDSQVRYTAADGFVPDYGDVPAPEEPPAPPSSDLAQRVTDLEFQLRALKSWAGSAPK